MSNATPMEQARRREIRIWDGCQVVGVISVGPGGTAWTSSAGGAANSTKVDIEIDPFAGLIVDHSANRSPVDFREPETDSWCSNDECETCNPESAA